MNLRGRKRANELLTVSVLTALFLLLGIGAMVWAVRGGALTPPTPTPTATPRGAVTATPDFRATRIVEDMLTQVAFSAELATAVSLQLLGGTPTPAGVALPGENSIMLPVISQVDAALATAIAVSIAETLQPNPPEATPAPGAESLPAAPDSPLQTPVQLPDIEVGGAPPTATEQTIQLPIVDQGGAATPSPAPPNVELATLAVTDTATATPTPTLTFTPEPPTATPTTPPTPTPTVPFAVQSLSAQVIGAADVPIRVGPGSLYTETAKIAVDQAVTLYGRDATGDWVWFCCLPSSSSLAWIRSINLRPTGNPTMTAPREASNPNDVTWLAEKAPDAGLPPLPTSVPALPADFSMLRVDKNNSGRVAAIPALPYQFGWPAGGQAGVAGQAYTTAVIVSGQNVLAASADGHLYSFDRDTGSQRWRYDFGEQVRVTPMAEGSVIYVLSASGLLTALVDLGQNAGVLFQRNFAMEPHGAILAASNRVIFVGRRTDGEHLWIVDKATGAILKDVALGAAPVQTPAVGGNIVYVAGDSLRAVDIFTGDILWQILQGTIFTAPPLFASPGVNTLAELYLADNGGRVLALNAHTRETVWATPIGSPATSLAASESMLFAAGNGSLRTLLRLRRDVGQVIWQSPLPGNVPGGVLVDAGRVLVAAEGGNVQIFDAQTGGVGVSNVQTGSALGGAAAVSGSYIFLPTQSGILYALRGDN